MAALVRSINRIWSADAKGQTAVVVELCKKHLRKSPRNPAVLIKFGDALTELHQYASAERALRRAIIACPKKLRHLPFARMGDLYQARGDFKKAKLWYRRAMLQKPGDAGYHILLGIHLIRQGKIRQAEMHFLRATKCSEGCIEEAYFNLGGIMLGRRRYVDALNCYRKALKIDSKYTWAAKKFEDAKLALQLRNS